MQASELDFTSRFAHGIKAWRKRLQMTVEEFAEFVGTSANTIYNYENGHTMPQLYVALQISTKLGTTLDGLLRGE